MTNTTLFTNNRSQAVRMPADARFPESVKKVDVRVVGPDRVVSPAGQVWDTFFMPPEGASTATDDFLSERASQHQSDREAM